MSVSLAERLARLADNSRSFDEQATSATREIEKASAREAESTSRIRGWVTAANAGALLICFNSLLGGQVCDWSLFQPLVKLFVAGLSLTFLAVVADRRHHALVGQVMSRARSVSKAMVAMAATFESAKAAIERDDTKSAEHWTERAEQEMASVKALTKDASRRANPVWSVLAGLLELGGVVCLASGLLWVVSDARFVGALCIAAP